MPCISRNICTSPCSNLPSKSVNLRHGTLTSLQCPSNNFRNSRLPSHSHSYIAHQEPSDCITSNARVHGILGICYVCLVGLVCLSSRPAIITRLRDISHRQQAGSAPQQIGRGYAPSMHHAPTMLKQCRARYPTPLLCNRRRISPCAQQSVPLAFVPPLCYHAAL